MEDRGVPTKLGCEVVDHAPTHHLLQGKGDDTLREEDGRSHLRCTGEGTRFRQASPPQGVQDLHGTPVGIGLDEEGRTGSEKGPGKLGPAYRAQLIGEGRHRRDLASRGQQIRLDPPIRRGTPGGEEGHLP